MMILTSNLILLAAPLPIAPKFTDVLATHAASLAINNIRSTDPTHQRISCTFQGVESEDHFDAGMAFPSCLCITADKDPTEYHFPNLAQCSDWASGDKVELVASPILLETDLPQHVRESTERPQWFVDRTGFDVKTVVDHKPSSHRALYHSGSLQSRSTLALSLVYTDQKPACDAGCVKAGNPTVVAATEGSSYNQMKWGRMDAFDIDMNKTMPSNICSKLSRERSEALAILTESMLNDIPHAQYNHIELFIPWKSNCNWYGMAGLHSRYSYERTKSMATRVHELGHNFGFHHAATVDTTRGDKTVEYGDSSGPMGRTNAGVGFILPSVFNMGWLDAKDLATWSGDQRHAIRSLREDPRTTTVGETSGVRLQLQNDRTAIWLSFRTPDGIDAKLPSSTQNKVYIHAAETQKARGQGSTRQHSIALSSCEAEIMALSDAAKEIVYFRKLVSGLDDSSVMGATVLATDSQSARDSSYNPENHGRLKHVERRHFFIRDMIEKGEIVVPLVKTKDNFADFLTKPLGPDDFYTHRASIMNERAAGE